MLMMRVKIIHAKVVVGSLCGAFDIKKPFLVFLAT